MTTIHCQPYPATWLDHDRIVLSISTDAGNLFNKLPRGEEGTLKGIVAFDSTSNKWYAIRRFPCFVDSFECCCSAQAKELADKDEKWIWPPVEFPDAEEGEE